MITERLFSWGGAQIRIVTNDMGKKMINVRFDERTLMLLDELSDITKTSISVIVRGMVYRSIEELIDKSGNWRMKNEKNKEGESK